MTYEDAAEERRKNVKDAADERRKSEDERIKKSVEWCRELVRKYANDPHMWIIDDEYDDDDHAAAAAAAADWNDWEEEDFDDEYGEYDLV
jgi:hypothetical protein